MALLAVFAREYKDLPTLGYTHYQPAQLVTVGKRATLWLNEFLLDYQALEWQIEQIDQNFRGVKGTTGTQASFLELFDGDHDKVKALNVRVTQIMGFKGVTPVSGQTYTRKIDNFVVNTLAGIAQTANKMGGDLRLLQAQKEVEEPFEKSQVGSSAMAYKRNPMRSERICSLSRHVMSLPSNTMATAANQWFERTLDDSANRRIVLPEAFLGVDVILGICCNVVDGLVVWPNVIRKHVDAELPFMATENILMACVKAGGDRQELHEAIREHSMAAGRQVKEFGAANDLLARIAADDRFKPVHGELDALVDPSLFVGRAPQQVEEFLAEHIDPILKKEAALLEVESVDKISV
jgi:adenylosuccinate lyase